MPDPPLAGCPRGCPGHRGWVARGRRPPGPAGERRGVRVSAPLISFSSSRSTDLTRRLDLHRGHSHRWQGQSGGSQQGRQNRVAISWCCAPPSAPHWFCHPVRIGCSAAPGRIRSDPFFRYFVSFVAPLLYRGRA